MTAFKWTDEESELLLNTTLEYKTQKEGEGIDWDSIQTKYGEITEKYTVALLEARRNNPGKF